MGAWRQDGILRHDLPVIGQGDDRHRAGMVLSVRLLRATAIVTSPAAGSASMTATVLSIHPLPAFSIARPGVVISIAGQHRRDLRPHNIETLAAGKVVEITRPPI